MNFTVTEKGLEDQLLAAVVNKERAELEEQRSEVVQQQNDFTIRTPILSSCPNPPRAPSLTFSLDRIINKLNRKASIAPNQPCSRANS